MIARVGSLTADYERFMPWRTTDGADVAPKGAPEMSVLIEGVFARPRLLSLLRDFTVFGLSNLWAAPASRAGALDNPMTWGEDSAPKVSKQIRGPTRTVLLVLTKVGSFSPCIVY